MCSRCHRHLDGAYWVIGSRREPTRVCGSCLGWDERGWHRRAWRCQTCDAAHDDVGWRPRRYCDDRCMRAARAARRRYGYVSRAVSAGPRTCNGCGRSFRGRTDARYCSGACRQRAYRVQASENARVPLALIGEVVMNERPASRSADEVVAELTDIIRELQGRRDNGGPGEGEDEGDQRRDRNARSGAPRSGSASCPPDRPTGALSAAPGRTGRHGPPRAVYRGSAGHRRRDRHPPDDYCQY